MTTYDVDEPIRTSIEDCARCGNDHEDLAFNPFAEHCPEAGPSKRYTHWTSCPVNGEPILLTIVEVPEGWEDVLPEKLQGDYWYPHGKELTSSHLARIVRNVVEGREPNDGITDHRSSRVWDRAATLLKNADVLEYSGSWQLTRRMRNRLRERGLVGEGEVRRIQNADDFIFRPCRKTTVVHAVPIEEDFVVETLEGEMYGEAGDYLMRGVNGELYPCEASVFESTYEFVD